METVNRLENLVSDIIDMGDSDDMMLAITEVLTDTEIIPDVGKYYTFIYSSVRKYMKTYLNLLRYNYVVTS